MQPRSWESSTHRSVANPSNAWISRLCGSVVKCLPRILQEALNCLARKGRGADDSHDSTTTRCLVLTAAGTPFERPGPTRKDFRDRRTDAILVIQAGSDKTVSWTKPQDLVFDSAAPVASLGKFHAPGFHFVTVKGAVRTLKTSVPPGWFKSLVTSARDDPVDQN